MSLQGSKENPGGGDAGLSRKGRRSRSDLPVLRSAARRRSGERRRARKRKGRPCARRGRPEGRAAGPRTGNGAHPRTVRPDREDRKGARRGAGQAVQEPRGEIEGRTGAPSHPGHRPRLSAPLQKYSSYRGAPPPAAAPPDHPVVPPVFSTAGVPQGAYFVREWGVRPSSVTAIPATPATEGFLHRMVRQEKVTVRCKRFRGTFLEVAGTAVGGVSLAHKHSHFPFSVYV